MAHTLRCIIIDLCCFFCSLNIPYMYSGMQNNFYVLILSHLIIIQRDLTRGFLKLLVLLSPPLVNSRFTSKNSEDF